ncbi:MAG: hypothetical protein ACLPX9_16995 [Rhodomicrobium sp.]
MLSEDLSITEDATAEFLSTLEALDDIADGVEAIVLSLGGAQEREAYFAIAEEYEAYAEALLEETAPKSPEQDARLMDLEKRMESAFNTMLEACPEHIRKLHGAVRAAIDAEEASED